MTFHVLFDARAQREVEEVVAYLDRVAPEHTSRLLDDLEAVVATDCGISASPTGGSAWCQAREPLRLSVPPLVSGV